MKHVKLTTVGVAAFALGAVTVPSAAYAAGYFSTTIIASGTGTVSCPYGSRMTGGGAELTTADSFGTSSSAEYQIRSSKPTSNGWSATGNKISGSFSSSSGWRFTTWSYSPRVFAICAK